jgi:nitrogen fixation/metabolism regulation signal transduction histidine kinase
MQSEWPYLILGAVFVLTAIFIGASLRGGSRLQRRLFVLFLMLSFLPATLVLLINWNMSQRQLSFLQSPGLRSAMESSLDLARLTLERERTLAQEAAAGIAERIASGEQPPPEPPAGCAYYIAQGGERRIRQGPGASVALEELDAFDPLGTVMSARRRLGGGEYLLAAHPLGRPEAGAVAPVLVLAWPLDSELAAHLDAVTLGSSRYRQLGLMQTLLRGDILLTLAALGFVLLLASLLSARHLARQIGGPLNELTRGTERVAEGDLDHRLGVDAVDELGDLVAAFNRMTMELKTSKEELVRAERVAAWQGIARRLAHEIKNPLTPIGLSMHRIRKKVDDPTVTECVDAVLEETANLKRLADEFSSYARLPAPAKEELDIGELVRAVVELYAGRSRIDIRWEGWRDDLRLMGDPGQLRQVFANLVKNAAEAMAGEGTLMLSMRVCGELLSIRIKDSGPGLPAPAEELFAPYFSTKESGTGLGLAIARKIVEDHGGGLRAETLSGGETGAFFQVDLPGIVTGDQAATVGGEGS